MAFLWWPGANRPSRIQIEHPHSFRSVHIPVEAAKGRRRQLAGSGVELFGGLGPPG